MVNNDFPARLGRTVGNIVAVILAAGLIVLTIALVWRFCVWAWPAQ